MNRTSFAETRSFGLWLESLWHRPTLLNTLSDLLFLSALAVLLAAALVWVVRIPAWPVRQVDFIHPLQHVSQEDIANVLPNVMNGNFFNLDVDAMRLALMELPWVRQVKVRRVWPARLQIELEEHRPLAHWGDRETVHATARNAQNKNAARGDTVGGTEETTLVNAQGEIFTVPERPYPDLEALPWLYGPTGTVRDLLHEYDNFVNILAACQQQPREVYLSPRLAWEIRLHNGVFLRLGRESEDVRLLRLQRYVAAYVRMPERFAVPDAVLQGVDLRYQQGMALEWDKPISPPRPVAHALPAATAATVT